MSLKEKVASKVKVGKSGGSGKSLSFLTPLLLVALLIIGCFTAWQLMQLNSRLNGSLPADSGLNSMSGDSGSTYEYAVDFIFDTNLSGRMAQRGKEGWQVVGSRRTQDSITGQLGYEFIFMRKAAQ